jgi:hypothetical protein
MAKPQIGDVVEIRTNRGLAYALYTHEHEQYGSLLRVFSRILLERPREFETFLAEQTQFDTFYPLLGAAKRGIVKIAGHVEIPANLQRFPIFRAEGGISRDGRVLNWWLWDGVREWRIGDLSSNQKQFPIRGTVNHTLLVERIESGWKSSDSM